MKFKELATHYLNSMDFEQLERNSQLMYRSWAIRVPESATVGVKALYQWFKSLPLRASSKNQGLSVICSIYSFGVRYELIEPADNISIYIKKFRSTSVMPAGFTEDEINAIYAEAANPAEKVCACFLKILFWTGARPSEILALTWADIDYTNHLIAIKGAKKREKGVISRYCNLLPVILDCLQDLYEGEKRHGDPVRIFKLPSIMGNRVLSIEYAGITIKSIGARIGITKTLRQARTGLATAMLAGGYSITDVQQTLGHKSISSTQRYIRPSPQDKARVFKGL